MAGVLQLQLTLSVAWARTNIDSEIGKLKLEVIKSVKTTKLGKSETYELEWSEAGGN